MFDETPRLHANKVTYSDDPVGEEASSGEMSNSGHEDEVMVGSGTADAEADERELEADVEEGTPPEAAGSGANESFDESDGESDDAGEPAESAGDAGEPESDEGQPSGSKELTEAEESAEEGVDDPEQKESEGVDEVAPATSKISEDVHGGDEATKDIEDSPNAANDGQHPENDGAEVGEGGEDGAGENGESGTSGQSEGEGDPFAQDGWEDAVDQVVSNQELQERLAEMAQVRPALAAGGGTSIDYSGGNWDNDALRVVFHQTRELIRRLVSDEDVTRREPGTARWWAKELGKQAVTYRHHRIPSARFDRPKDNNIVFFMDVSGSVSMLAELFMAIMGGAAGLPGVRIVVGSEAHAENEIVVEKPFNSVDKAVEYFRHTVNAHVCDDSCCRSCKGKIRNTGWMRPYDRPFEPGVVEFLRSQKLYNSTTTCVFFGDMQGVHFDTGALRRLTRDVKCLWLFTDEPGHHTHAGDLPRAVQAGLPIVYNVRDARSFEQGVRRLAIR
jgi:hypothetical protein